MTKFQQAGEELRRIGNIEKRREFPGKIEGVKNGQRSLGASCLFRNRLQELSVHGNFMAVGIHVTLGKLHRFSEHYTDC